MSRILMILGIITLATACGFFGQIEKVSIKNKVGVEFRNVSTTDSNERYSLGTGIDIKSTTGYGANIFYRFRDTNWSVFEQEHGVFFGFNVPLYKKK